MIRYDTAAAKTHKNSDAIQVKNRDPRKGRKNYLYWVTKTINRRLTQASDLPFTTKPPHWGTIQGGYTRERTSCPGSLLSRISWSHVQRHTLKMTMATTEPAQTDRLSQWWWAEDAQDEYHWRHTDSHHHQHQQQMIVDVWTTTGCSDSPPHTSYIDLV